MKNKILWILIGVFIIASTSGFLIGRYYTIKNNLSLYLKEIPEKIPVDEINRYREEMKKLKNTMEKEQKDIIFAAKKGEIEKMREHIDSITKVKKEILLETAEHLHKVSLSFPPQIRESFIEQRLKPSRVIITKFEQLPVPHSELIPLPEEIEKFKENAESFLNSGDFENAIEQYESIIMKVPEHVISRIEIGNAYRKLNQFDKAKEYYLDVLEIEPNNLNAYYRLIDMEISRKNLPEVNKYLKETFKISPKNGIILNFDKHLDVEDVIEEKTEKN
jgi:tetratricopeptide (TPR) repeat protein